MDLTEPAVWPLGQQLRELRHAARWTQRGLAEAAGVSIGVVRDLEQGVSQRPRPDSLRRLAAALGITLPELAPAAEPDTPPAAVSLAAPNVTVAQPVRLQVLGPLLAWRRGTPVRLGGSKQRALLGLLALHPGAVGGRDAIGEVLWGAHIPASAPTMIQSHVSRLRGLLDSAGVQDGRGGLLEAAGSGYRLRADHADLDLVTYQGLTQRARTTLRAGDAASACDLFEQALGLWQGGEPVADVELLRGHPSVVAVMQHRAAVVVEYAEASCGAGWYDRVEPYLRALAELEPLNERAHACLMVALAGSGRQAAALDLYEKIRRRLDEQLGLQPGPHLSVAHMQVLRHDVPPATPGPAAGSSSKAADPARSRAGIPVPSQLPPAVADFSGRSAELAALRGLLLPGEGRAGVPVVVISGPPGAGKSTLMIQAAQTMRSMFPDGQLWAPLQGASEQPRDPGDVLGEFLRALGVPGFAVPGGTHERAALYRSRLADRRMLVAVDDAASAGQVLPLLPGTGGSAVVVTSRRRLIELPGSRPVLLGPMTPDAAAELLGQIAGSAQVSAERQAVAGLAASCGHLPLALRIAGARLAAGGFASIASLATAVADERNRLNMLQIGDLSVRASLASGYESLSAVAQRAFRLLSLLGPGDVAEWAITALLGQAEATAVLNELCDRSMLTLCGTDLGGQARFRLHDLVRSFACEQLAQEPEAGQAAALHRAQDGWLQLASLASGKLPANPFMPPAGETPGAAVVPAERADRITAHPLAWFATERLNLLAAVSAACVEGRYAFAAQLASAQAAYEHLQDRHDDAEASWRRIAEAAASAGDQLAEVQARVRFGAALLERNYSAAALDVIDPCIQVLDEIADASALAGALYWRSASAWDLGSYEQARCDAERGIALAQQAGSRHTECMNLRGLAVSLAKLGQHDQAIQAGEHALTIAAELADESYIKVARHTLATSCAWVGEYHRAVELCQRNFELCRRAGDARMTALTLGVLGDALSGLGRHQEAVDMLSSALPVFREHAHERYEALCLLKRGCAHHALGHQAEAVGDLERSLPIFRRLSLLHYEQRAQRALDECLATAAVRQ